MSQDIDFPDFPYFSIKYVYPNAHTLNNLMYPSLIERYLSRLDLIGVAEGITASPLPSRFGACRVWKSLGNPSRPTLTHKHRGNVNPQFISYALARPDRVGELLARRRLPRMSYSTLCGRPGCLHPLHVHSHEDPVWGAVLRPRKRTTRREIDWLTLPECGWLQHKMLNSFAKSLEDPITQISDDLGVHFSTLVDIWNTMVDLDRKAFYETFIVEGEHHRG